MDDEFLRQYEDELEALEDMDSEAGLPVKGKKSLDFSTPRTPHVRKKVTDPDASLNESLILQQFDSEKDDSLREISSCDKENVYDKKRKHDQCQKSDGISDDEGALVIDADIPDLVPATKKPRIGKTPAKNLDSKADDDFVITPPPSPGRFEASVPQAKSKHQPQTKQVSHEDRLIENYDFDRRRVHRKIPTGAYFYVTNEEGRRVYMQLRSLEAIKQCSAQFAGHNSLQLLGTPLHVLKMQAEEQRCKRLLGEADRLNDIVNRGLEDSSPEDVIITDEAERDDKTDLWVERYKPQKYIELLSDETTNRTLLKWLKLWDYVVFGKQKKPKPLSSKSHDTKKTEQNKFQNKNQYQLSEDLDDLKRPVHKVALLAGPPGLGKTTMAHVIAQHGGYNIVEMNASDDRSADVFKQRIEAATQMKAVLGADPRPNCLIIDEIDGAPQPAINMLLSIIKRGDKDSTSTTKRRKKDESPLLRPIICICNDLYVPALRQLRQQAFVITIPQIASPTLASRLLEISHLEQIRTDLTTLLALCEKADNDIRSCLNTLQFIKSRATQLSLQHVRSMSLGQKDSHKSLFSVWQHIFTMPRPKRKQYINPHDRKGKQDSTEDLALALSANNMTLSARFHNILQMALAAGEHQKILQGMHENYLESKVKGHRMLDSVMLATEWMQFADILDNKINQHQDYSLMRYFPYLPVLFHLLFATNHPQKINYPHSQYEVVTKSSRNESLIASMITEMAPAVRKHLNLLISVTEVLPPLLSIIQPSLRPVNTQLYSAKEKKELAQLVQIMISYNLTYHQERTMEGQYNYVLDPNLDEVIRFPGLKAAKQLTYAAKQLIAREIELEKMRRSELALGSRQRNQQEVGDNKADDDKNHVTPKLPKHMMQTLRPKCVVEDVPVVDFFGRRVTPDISANSSKQGGAKKTPEVIGGDIWYKFKEGFTNAVRKTVRIGDLV